MRKRHIIKIVVACAVALATCLAVLVIYNNRGRIRVSTRPDGIDVSHHQGEIDWATVKGNAPSLKFVYIKLSEGATYTDPKGVIYAEGAKKNGFLIGGYHYFRMTSEPFEQFEHFTALLDQINPDLVPMVDIEQTDGRPIYELQGNLAVFLTLLKERYNKDPMIYGTNASYNGYCAPHFNHFPLYLGRFGKERTIITGKGHYTIWQYTENGSLPGIEKEVDFCRFHPDCGISDIMLPCR